MTDADVLVVGGGIAGLSAAWFAARRGRDVTIVDEGLDRASDVPVALVNPLRGHAGRLIAGGVDGMHATFALVDALRARGHAVDAARGLYRPLVDRTGDAATEGYWRDRLDGRLAFDWHARAPASLGLVDAVPTLALRDAGWVAPGGLLAALDADATPTRIAARVIDVRADAVVLADGSTLRARAVVWCAGARGAAALASQRSADDEPGDGVFKPGSLCSSSAPLTDASLSFGLYVLPSPAGTIVGPTREDARSTFAVDETPPDAVRHLASRIARTFGTAARPGDFALAPAWRGVRLARMPTGAAKALEGVATITALGSRGFLMAPLLAERWARTL